MISFDILGNIYPRVEQLPAVPLVEPKKNITRHNDQNIVFGDSKGRNVVKRLNRSLEVRENWNKPFSVSKVQEKYP